MLNVIMTFFGLCLLAAGPARAADDVVRQIDAGKAYYQEGDLARALVEFEFALSAVRAEFSSRFMATLPEPPAFWSAEAPAVENAAALLGGGVMVTRQYRDDKGEGRITAELMVDNPMAQAFSAVIGNPILVAGDPSLKRLRFGDATGLLNWNADEAAGDLSLTIGGRVLAKLAGRGLDDAGILIDLMKSWDLEAVSEIAGR